jgi:membrane protein DedA with SNARE-associated domain
MSVAFGRMVGMRLPMMMVCAGKKKPGTLALGVFLSSLVWDSLYISLGAVFGSTMDIPQIYMLLISLGGITAIYLVTWLIQKLIKRLRHRPVMPQPVTAKPVTTALGFPMPLAPLPVPPDERKF